MFLNIIFGILYCMCDFKYNLICIWKFLKVMVFRMDENKRLVNENRIYDMVVGY